MAALSTGLLHLAATKNLGATTIEALCAFSTYATEVQEFALAEKVWDRIKSIYVLRDEQQEQMTEIIEKHERVRQDVEGSVGKLAEEVRNLLQGQTNLARELEDVKRLKADLAEALDTMKQRAAQPEPAAWEPAPLPTQNANGARKPSYAATVMHILPTSHATSIAQQDVQIRQVLIDIKKNENEDPRTQLTDREYLAKAMLTLDMMRTDGFAPPEGMKFVTVKRLRNGGLLYELNAKEGASWLQRRENMKPFTDKFGLESAIRARHYPCLLRGVPTYFDPGNEDRLRELEEENGWDRYDLTAAHWIKPENKRRPGQTSAYLIAKFSSPQRANDVILHGVSLLGRRVQAKRLVKEARRCLKCQRLEPGHLAKDCDMIVDVCGTCGQDHKTNECTTADWQHHCVNCKEGGHAAWSRMCPAFIEATRKVQGADKLAQYRFFPLMDDPTTWDHTDPPFMPSLPQVHEPRRHLSRPSSPFPLRGPGADREDGEIDYLDYRPRSLSPARLAAHAPRPALNVNKSNTSQSALLHSISDYDVVLLQEPHIDFLKNTRASQQWRVIYPPKHKDSPTRTRSVTLINTRIATNSWSAIPVDCPDITAVSLHYDTGTIHLFNTYNPQDSQNVLRSLARATRNVCASRDELDDPLVIWLGDFNRHHPYWDDERNEHLFTNEYLDQAQPLIDLLTAFDFSMLLPAGIPTLEASNSKNHTRPDNVFASQELVERLIRCRTAPELRPPRTDHYPIVTELQVDVPRARSRTFRNFRKADWVSFRKNLAGRLEEVPLPQGDMRSVQEFDDTLAELLTALTKTIDEEVPITKPPPFAKRWFSKELDGVRREVSRLGRQAYKLRDFPDHPIHREYRTLRNRYGDQIRHAKRDHWNAWIEEADTRDVWTIGKFIRAGSSDGGKGSIPPMRRPGSDTTTRQSEEKGKIFFDSFFPAPPPEAARRLRETYPDDAFEFTNVSDAQIVAACKRLKEFKAPGPDGIPNEVYKRCSDILLPFLGRLFRATFDLRYYPDAWKESLTVVLRKPGRTDYSIAKSYRPIALMNCMGKLLSSCITETLEYELERLHLFPNHHFGGRAGRTTTDSLHLLTKTVYDAWRTKKVVSILFLDVEAAFPSAIPERLFSEMRKLGIPEVIVDWLRRKLQGRKTRLSFDDFVSHLFEIFSGIDQGCPLSVLLYKIYNLVLLECADNTQNVSALGFIDDVGVLAVGKNLGETNGKLRNYMERRGGAKEWSRTRNSKFALNKLALLHADPRLKGADMGPELELRDGKVTPTDVVKFLGVNVDNKLTFKQHTEYALRKGTTWLQQFNRLARPKNGLVARNVLTLYKQMLLPAMLYAASVWITPQREIEGRKQTYGSVGKIKKLARIHRQACILITGAMKTTATDILEAHLNLPPFHLLVDRFIAREATRLCALPTTHPLHWHVQHASTPVQHRKSPLHERSDSPPGWTPPFPVHIADSKDDAAISERTWARKPGYRVYTDGSDIDNGIGASAVLYRPGAREPVVLRHHLGSSTRHTVYEAEIVGLILAAHLLIQELSARAASCAADNMPCLLAVQNRKPHPAHYLIDWLLREINAVLRRHPGIKFSLRWVPGHRDIEGNERADQEAKKAARGEGSSAALLPKCLAETLPASLSKVRQTLNETFTPTSTESRERTPPYAPRVT
ncbi:hypothetical protein EVJ58_g10059 [Rhodofomes roseus]|uniref:Reverse transcriptase (RNA-dependent DNA polymerase) n=1 Tax=Rhodofomes roseus TaxID=34475 RepID=A0A4Y9XSI8_9APHY|nr:hypothetical protein EVJ58_g10059 [Rhodofomes roseus]